MDDSSGMVSEITNCPEYNKNDRNSVQKITHNLNFKNWENHISL
jgi:hypothetical protein